MIEQQRNGVRYQRTVVGTLFIDDTSGRHHFLDERGPQFFPSAQAAYETLEREGWTLRVDDA